MSTITSQLDAIEKRAEDGYRAIESIEGAFSHEQNQGCAVLREDVPRLVAALRYAAERLKYPEVELANIAAILEGK